MATLKLPRRLATAVATLAAITCIFSSTRGPGEYNGVVIFDRWGSCHLYSGVYLMEISSRVQESLRPHAGKPVLIRAEDVYQPMNPGDGLIRKLRYLGPSTEPAPIDYLNGISIRTIPSFPPQGPAELIIEVRNTGNLPREIGAGGLAPTLFHKGQDTLCSPADGPSFAAITRLSVSNLLSSQANGCMSSDTEPFRLLLLPGYALPDRFGLEPGKTIEVPLRFSLPPGEYEFLAGYGGGVHSARSLASNPVDFDVDARGAAHLTQSSLPLNQTRAPHRYSDLSGMVVAENGGPVAGATVVLWPLPRSKWPRAAATTTSRSDGKFTFNSVLEGRYLVTASRHDSNGALSGAFGGRNLTDAATLSVPGSLLRPVPITVHRQPVYILRGQTEAPGQSSEKRVIYLRMVHGDAIPFEWSAIVQPDGRYEFRNVPAGFYQLNGGSNGYGFELAGNLNLPDEFNWPKPRSTVGAAIDPAGEVESNETLIGFALQHLRRVIREYRLTYTKGFPPSLDYLRPPPEWSRTTAERAGLVSEFETWNFSGGDGLHISENGYIITYHPSAPDASHFMALFTFSARPDAYGKTGRRSFFVDESGIVRCTVANRPATPSDPVWRP